MINLGHTRELGLTGSDVRVAVIDSGLNPAHEDLDYTKIETGWNYSENNNNTTDTHGHGSFVSGLICAVNQNGLGYNGIAPDVTLIPLKITDIQNSTTIALTVQSIYGAVDDYHCDVLNLSLGTTTLSTPLQSAIAYAVSQNVIIVAAAGNSGANDYFFPASYEGVISVGSVGSTKLISAFSQENDALDVVAPGEGIGGLWSGLANAYRENGSGTSFAAPQVTALAALAKQAKPGMTPDDFLALLISGAEDLGAPGYDTSYGYGLIDIEKTLQPLFVLEISGTAETKSTGVEFKAEIHNLIAGSNLQVVAASYLSTGRMSGLSYQSITVDATRSVRIDLILTSAQDAVKVKLFLLGEWDLLLPIHRAEVFTVIKVPDAALTP